MGGREKRSLPIVLSLITVLAVVSFSFDSKIFPIIKSLRTDFLSSFFLNFGSLGTIFVLLIILTAAFAKEHRRKWILPLWFSAGMSALVSLTLKMWIQRPRPFQEGLITLLNGLGKASYSLWDFSFPSFHAMVIFAMLPFLDEEFPRFKYVWIMLALIICFSRIYLGVHFLSDVLSGGLIGYLIGYVVISSERKHQLWRRICNRFF